VDSSLIVCNIVFEEIVARAKLSYNTDNKNGSG